MYFRCLCLGLVQLLLLTNLKSTICVKNNYQKKPQVESSGWRTVDVTPLKLTNEKFEKHRQQQQINENNQNLPTFAIKSKKLVEWDDDDNSLSSSLLVIPYEDSDTRRLSSTKSTTVSPTLVPVVLKKWSKKAGKLIYHGQVKQNGTSRVIDGVKLHINTYRPVSIIRNPSHPPLRSESTFEFKLNPELDNQEEMSLNSLGELRSRNIQQDRIYSRRAEQFQDVSWPAPGSAGSDWRPMFMNVRSGRAEKSNPKEGEANQQRSNESVFGSLELAGSRWRPLARKRSGNLRFNERVDSTNEQQKNLLDYSRVSPSSIEEPFDDEGILTSIRGDNFSSNLVQNRPVDREAKSLNISFAPQDIKWKPVDLTTLTNQNDLNDIQTTTLPSTTLPSSTPALTVGNGNHSESAQRSASDLNYIYSSQQANQQQAAAGDWTAGGTSRQSNGYYPGQPTSYNMQPVAVEQQQAAIIDTVSGQTPEMIEPRTSDAAMLPMPEFALPQTGASFQAAQVLPTRQQAVYSYDTGSYYTTSSRLPIRQQVVAPTPTVSPSQFVRQEHHYHYYNNQAHSQQSNQPATSVIREIQPLLISQPIIQSAPSSTPSPAPQLVREIIKEVPVPVQVPRILIPAPPTIHLAPPPPPVPISVQRDVIEAPALSAYSYAAPAQRIMRQISHSIPVAMSMRQIRLPVPTIQLPIHRLTSSNPAPVTRQTGSFIIPPMAQKTTTYLTETQAMPTHTTIMHTTQFTPATRTTVYTTDHQPNPSQPLASPAGYKR